MSKLIPIIMLSLFLAFCADKLSVFETNNYGQRQYKHKNFTIYATMAFCMAVFVGLRLKGNDTGTYRYAYELTAYNLNYIKNIEWFKFAQAPGLTFLCCLFKQFEFSSQDYLMIMALFTIGVYLWFIRKYSNNLLFSVFLFITMGIYDFTMAAIKQTTAVAFLLIATDRAINHKTKRFVLWILIAELLHPYAFIYLIVPFLFFLPWSKKTRMLLVGTIITAFSLPLLLNGILAVTDAMGGGYDDNSFTGDGVNIFRVLVVWVPIIISFLYRKQIQERNDRILNLVINLSMINALIMFIGLFGTANYFARLANYFLIFQALSLPELLTFFSHKDKKLIYPVCIACYCAYYYYQCAIANGAFDDNYSFMTIREYLNQLFVR